jgi:serine/threonine protein kinase
LKIAQPNGGVGRSLSVMHETAEPTTETLHARTDFDAGHRIDRYELRELIGRGGMGSVYRAIDTKLGRTVAVKTVAGRRSGARLTDRVRQRFLREAMALSKVEHRNVVQVMDFGFADDGTPFLVMEHLRGRDLGALLAQSQTPPTVAHVVDIMLGVCAALRACHRVGIVHRDLKPGNIFLVDTDTGAEVKVLDFGVSKAPTSDDLTREGQIVGTPQYLAPEQVDGKVGPASDQYALGVLIYACLTLRLPYEDHQSFGLLRAIETGKFESPRMFRPDLPEALERIVLRAMHVVPGERFESVYALGRELWPLASPRGRDEWRNYYFPPEAGDQAPTQIGEVARTQILQRTQILPRPITSDQSAVKGALLYLSTKLAKPRTPAQDPVEPEAPAAGEAEIETDVGARRWRLSLPGLAVAVVSIAVGIGVVRVRTRRPAPSWPRAAVSVSPLTKPAAVQPPVVGERFVGAHSTSTPQPPKRPIGPAHPDFSPPERVDPNGPAREAPAELVPPAPEPAEARRRRRAPARRPHAPFAKALPNIDHNGIGIPND